MPKPPLGLSVEITDASGTRYRWDSAGKAANIPQSLSFSTKKFEGFEAGSCTLPRRIDQDYVDIGLYHDVAFIGDDGSIAYEGRIASNPRSLGEESHQMTVNCAGWMAHTKDRKFSEIYVDRDLSAWGTMARGRQALLLGSNYAYPLVTSGIVSQDGASSLMALTLQMDRVDVASGSSKLAAAEALYSSPVPIGSVYYDQTQYDKGGGGIQLPGANWGVYIGTGSGDQLTGSTTTADLAGTASAAYYTSAFTDHNCAFVGLYWESGNLTSDGHWRVDWRKLAVYGTHGLTKRGDAPGGFYASDVIADIVSRFCPKLNTAGVQATTYAIPHLAFKDRIFPYDAFLEINKYHLWQFGVWENKTFHFQPHDLTDYDWEVRLSDPGVTVELQGDSTEELANGIVVQYQDVLTGETEVLTPADTPSLSDTSVTNPANTHGLTVWTEISVSTPTTADAATQIGIASLAEFNQPKAPGTIRVKGHIKDRAGHWQQGWKVRAGDTVAITDHPNSRPRLVGETSWDHESKTLTIACDTTIQRLPAIFDRVGVALTAANLS